MKWLVTIAIVCAAAVERSRADSCHLRELDICAASVAGVKSVPVNDADIDKYCGLAKEAKECVDAFADKCTTPLQKELMSYVLNDGSEENAKKFCTKGDEMRNNYLKHAPCLAKTQPQEKKCTLDLQAALEKMEEAPFDAKISTACCAYARHKKCTHDVVEGECGAEAVEYGLGVIHMMSSNLIDVMCQGFDTNPQCASLLPPPGTAPKGNGKSLIGKVISAYTKE